MDNDELLIKIKEMYDARVDGFTAKVDDLKRHMGVIVENLENKVQIVAEGHDILNRKFDTLDAKVDTLSKKVDNLSIKVDVLDKRVDVLDKKVDGLDKRMDSMEKEISVVKDYVIGVDTKLNEHDVILKMAK